jgi:hypothetical protein
MHTYYEVDQVKRRRWIRARRLKGKEEHVIISHAGGRRREEEATAVKQ